ncbi:MAG: HAD-IC family P-type ATPase [bacterium]
MEEIDTSLVGLSDLEVAQRVSKGLINNYQDKTGRTYAQILKENVFNFINIILFILTILLISLGMVSDGIVYILVVFLNIIVGLVQEIYAKIKLDQISSLTSPKARILRGGKARSYETSQIVLDDLIILKEGDLIPVDGHLVEGQIQVDESLLTGESERVKKVTGSEVFSGSFAVSGQAIFKVSKIGQDSLANQITSKAKAYSSHYTPMQRDINLTIKILFLIAVVLVILVSLQVTLNKGNLKEGIQNTAVIAGIIPNSLFAIINLAYALGGVAILRRGALVQKLNAIESLSHVNVLCLDKTGTITTKDLILEETIVINSTAKNLDSALSCFVSSVSNTNATSEAIKKKYTGKKLQLLEEVNFSSEHKWSGILFGSGTKMESLILGAPEILLNSAVLDSKFEDTLLAKQNAGLRVLLFASCKAKTLHNKQNQPQLPTQIEIIGMLVFSDQIRKNARQTLDKFVEAGVELKIISGDSPQTVTSLAKQIGFSQNLKSISGIELEALDETAFSKATLTNTVFGRITPSQKERIVQVLKENGKYVAMTGDGVNDVLALKKADLSIAMESGSQATRNVADILLLKDSFSSLPYGLIEGQKIRSSLQNVFKIYLTRVIYLIMIIIAVSIIGLPFPLSVKQNALVATLAAGLPALFITIWSKPGLASEKSLFKSVLNYVVPASLTMSVFAITFFAGFTLIKSLEDGNIINDLLNTNISVRNSLEGVVPVIRTFLTSFLVASGLILLNFISIKDLQSKKIVFDWKILLSSLFLFLVFLFISIKREFGEFWGLEVLAPSDIMVLICSVIIWAYCMRKIWQHRILDRFLGVRLDG